MSQERQNNEDKLTRRGHPIYESNPSLSSSLPVKVKHKDPSDLGTAYRISRDTGEIVAHGAIGFWEEQEVDSEQFVKIYIAGIRQYGQLSKSGATMFEYVYNEISGKNGKDKDTVAINYLLAQRWLDSLSRRTYERGIKELLDKDFIFRSLTSEIYFVNVRYMFNGDRLMMAKVYQRKETNIQVQLPSDEPSVIDLEANLINE